MLEQRPEFNAYLDAYLLLIQTGQPPEFFGIRLPRVRFNKFALLLAQNVGLHQIMPQRCPLA